MRKVKGTQFPSGVWGKAPTYPLLMHFPEQTPVRRAPRQRVAKALQNEHDNQQHNHADVNDILMVLILAVVNRETADAARADRAAHRREANRAEGGACRPGDGSGPAFWR